MAESLSPHLNDQDPKQIKDSLRYGYSALVDLYKSSALYEEGNKKRANLLLIIDQFEEFFTNSENFNKENFSPSEYSQIAINLIIETALIAKEQNLPIYIACSIRSDFLGQCSAFSGFPKLISKNQYYLGRLNQLEIIQVIEEPAQLSGNSISKRLVQKLQNDIRGKSDNLPVLQHALYQIWKAADNGNKEMDLIHYAMVGGISKQELPDEDHDAYDLWIENSPVYQKELYNNTGLENVIHIHAETLFNTAHNYHNNLIADDTKKLSRKDAGVIIISAFKCLTKIDDNRAVRNLMSFEDICNMINTENKDDELSDRLVVYDIETINNVLNIFREPGNTFLHPFINSENNEPVLSPKNIIDITHEALIRNWNRLNQWAWDEHEDVTKYKEFRTQLDKWVYNNKDKAHLMSIGSLEYFNDWVNMQKSNPYTWLNRYMFANDAKVPTDKDKDEVIREHFKNIKDYIRLSKNSISRKKRLTRIAAVSITTLCIILGIAFSWAYQQKNKAEKLQLTIEQINKSNELASEAYMMLDDDPTYSFRLAEEAYKIHPGDLAKEVLMTAYATMPPLKNILEGHNLFVDHAVFSPNGNYILTTAGDKTTILWDIDGNLLQVIKGIMRSLHFSHDGKLFVTANNNDSTARVWNLEGTCLKILKDKKTFNKAILSPDNQYMLTLSGDNEAKLWNVNSDEFRLLQGHSKNIRDAVFTPGGELIITISDDHTARLWNINGECIKVLTGHKNSVNVISISSDGNRFVTGSSDKTARIWDLNGNCLKVLKHADGLSSPTYISDGNIATVSGNTARIWDMEGVCLQVSDKHPETETIRKVSPNGKYYVTLSSADGIPRLWSSTGRKLIEFKGHTSEIRNIEFSADSKYLITTSNDNTARLWNINVNENTAYKAYNGMVHLAQFSPDGKHFLTHSQDTVILWNRKGEIIQEMKSSSPSGWHYTGAAFSPDSQIIAAIFNNTTLLYDFNGEVLKELKGHNQDVYYVKFSPKSNYILTSSYDSTARIWDLEGNVLHVLQGHKGRVNVADISPDGKLIVTTSNVGGVRLWNNEGKCLAVLNKHTARVWFTQFSPDGNYFVTTSNDNNAIIWDKKGKEVAVLKGHTMGVFRADFSSNSKYVVTASDDNTARVWDLKGNETMILRHKEIVNEAIFSPDGVNVLTACDDNTMRLWDMNGNEIQVYRVHGSGVWRVDFSPDGKSILSGDNDGSICILPTSVKDVLSKVNIEKVRGDIWQLTKQDKQLYGIVSP